MWGTSLDFLAALFLAALFLTALVPPPAKTSVHLTKLTRFPRPRN
jgi:hypothetical protein